LQHYRDNDHIALSMIHHSDDSPMTHPYGGAALRLHYGKAEHPGGLGVDDQLEFDRLHHWQV
jgi:hypothetical protein